MLILLWAGSMYWFIKLCVEGKAEEKSWPFQIKWLIFLCYAASKGMLKQEINTITPMVTGTSELGALIKWKGGGQWERLYWSSPVSWQRRGMLLIKKFNSTTAALASEHSEVRPCESWHRLIRRRQILSRWGKAQDREALQQHTGPAGRDGILPTWRSGPPCSFPSPHWVESQAPSQVARVTG